MNEFALMPNFETMLWNDASDTLMRMLLCGNALTRNAVDMMDQKWFPFCRVILGLPLLRRCAEEI